MDWQQTKANKICLSIVIMLQLIICWELRVFNEYSWAATSTQEVVKCSSLDSNRTEPNWTEPIYHPKQISVTYGFLHMAKTGGTDINGQLAMHYERVCGNKGYSYDAHQTNLRYQTSGNTWAGQKMKNAQDIYSKQNPSKNRGKVSSSSMKEIGFEDCDYVALETGHNFWDSTFRNWYRPLELHVPCRDPIDHLMSMCNAVKKKIDCSAKSAREIDAAIRGCEVFLSSRFSLRLTNIKNIHLKCFRAPLEINEYIHYMGKRLERKSFETTYIHRDTNRKRKKENECIWKDTNYMEKVRDRMIQHKSGYYKFCRDCLDTENDLLS